MNTYNRYNRKYERTAEKSIDDLNEGIRIQSMGPKKPNVYNSIRDVIGGVTSLSQDRDDIKARLEDKKLYQKGVPTYKVNNMDGIGSLSKKSRNLIYKAHQEEAAKSLAKGQNTNPFRRDDFTMKTQNYSKSAIKKMDSKLLKLSEEIINPNTSEADVLKKQSVYDNIKNIREKVDSHINYSGVSKAGIMDGDIKLTYRPGEGVNGYGLGLNKFLASSDTALLGRGLGFMTFAGAGESLMNSFGILTATQQAVNNKEISMFKRAFSNASMIRMGALGSILYSTSTDRGLGGFVSDNLTYAGALQGWRIGTSLSPLGKHAGNVVGNIAATPFRAAGAAYNYAVTGNAPQAANFWKPASAGKISRAAYGLAGGITGAAIGALLVTAASSTISDITSNQSTIRKVAKNISTRTIYASTSTNSATSSSRQAALNKLARSGLNDRALLLGNEARILGGII